jgi:hypothetical protein
MIPEVCREVIDLGHHEQDGRMNIIHRCCHRERHHIKWRMEIPQLDLVVERTSGPVRVRL